MQAAQQLPPISLFDRLAEVERLVSENLCDDWVVRLEYTAGASPQERCWRPWGEAMSGLEGAVPVLDAIAECRDAYPEHTLRLCAEKRRVGARLYYPI